MNDDKIDKLSVERFYRLQQKRQEILSLPTEKAIDRILKDPQPAALVQSFPEQDFYFLIHDIGPEDALALLSLASDKQWEHIVDLEVWQKDRIDLKSVSRWLDLLLEADPKRFLRWSLEEKIEFVDFFLFKNIELRIREHDQDPSEFGDEFFSLDDVYFIRFIDPPGNAEADKLSQAQRRQFLTKFIHRLADLDHRVFQSVLLEATHVIPAETEEDCYRRRNLRLAEKGFLPFDEAVGIYQPVKPEGLEKQPAKFIPRSGDRAALLPVPQYPVGMLSDDNNFTRALAVIEPENVLPQIQAEFAALCNQIIIADHKRVHEREELRDIVKKACGFINIGLERLSADQKSVDPRQAAALITRYPLSQIFRAGFGGALELKWQAEKWLARSWFASNGLRLTFWGEQWLGVLGGLLIKKPLFHDNYKTGVLYREFASREDIASMADIFDQIRAVDDLLSLMKIHLAHPASYKFLTYKNLLLTLWAADYLRLPLKILKPIALNKFGPFFADLLPGSRDSGAEKPRRIPQAMKNHFLNWLSAATHLRDFEITERLGRTLETLFGEIEAELGRVSGQDLNPRYVQLFLITK